MTHAVDGPHGALDGYPVNSCTPCHPFRGTPADGTTTCLNCHTDSPDTAAGWVAATPMSNHEAIVTGGPSPYPTLLDGARAVAVIFAADGSARTGRAVDIALPEG